MLDGIVVRNDPVNWIDPWGLEADDLVGPGTVVDVVGAVGTTAMENAGMVTSVGATSLTLLLAPLGDLLFPTICPNGDDLLRQWYDLQEIERLQKEIDAIKIRIDGMKNF